MINLIVNNEKKTLKCIKNKTLFDYLRDDLGIITVKSGCTGQGSCGSCTVQINNKAKLSCITPINTLNNAKVLTLDAISKREKEAYSYAFVQKGGIQCGFCTPGIVMRAKVLINSNDNPNNNDIIKILNKHTCRCTGYKKIIDSIKYASKILREKLNINKLDKIQNNKQKNKSIFYNYNSIGKCLKKYNSYNKVIGTSPFVSDLKESELLHGILKFSQYPRAKILFIDIKEALKLDGIKRIFTAKDIPGKRNVGLIISDWPLMIDIGEETRYIGDVICGVVAKNKKVARKAIDLIKIKYKILKPVLTTNDALKINSYKIHKSGNMLDFCELARGDIQKAKLKSKFISKGIFKSQTIEHAFLEPECTLAKPWGDGVEVFSQGQGVYEDRRQIASILNIKKYKVKVVQISNGGAFGGKEDLTTQGHAALFSYLMQKPVSVSLTREESMNMHPKRHPFNMDYEVGCNSNGILTYLKADIISDTGAYASVGMKVIERGVGHACGAYFIPAIAITGKTIYTNNIPNGAMRGFGVTQSTFAIENCIDDLCEKGNFDRWKFRFNNIIDINKQTTTGEIIKTSTGLKRCLLAIKNEFYNSKYAGIACGMKNTGIGNGISDVSKVKIVVENENTVVIHHGWTEMGQGVHTIAQQFLSEETGIETCKIQVRVETSEEVECGMTTASRATSLIGHGIIEAAKKLKKDLREKKLEELIGNTYLGNWSFDKSSKPQKNSKKNQITHYSYSYAAQLAILNNKGKLLKITAAHDSGKVINPILFEGQIEGALHMGLGYAIRENFLIVNGRPKSTKLSSCKILKAEHMPEIEIIPIETNDANSPYGAKGVGEIGLVPTAAAVTNAVYQFDKKRRFSLPIKEKFLIK